MPRHAELAPQDMASILWSMADARFHHKALVEEFIRSLSFRAGVKSLVTAMLALDRLGLPADSLRAPFLQHLSGQCNDLSFGDLRRVLMALARCTFLFKVSSFERFVMPYTKKPKNATPVIWSQFLSIWVGCAFYIRS